MEFNHQVGFLQIPSRFVSGTAPSLALLFESEI
jgi:hypothetical protein